MLHRTKGASLLGILSQNFQARPETAGFLFAASMAMVLIYGVTAPARAARRICHST